MNDPNPLPYRISHWAVDRARVKHPRIAAIVANAYGAGTSVHYYNWTIAHIDVTGQDLTELQLTDAVAALGGDGGGLMTLRDVFGPWLAKGTTPGAYRPMLCGTKTTERRGPDDFRVVCATCGAGGSHRYLTHASASDAATRASSRACRACVAS